MRAAGTTSIEEGRQALRLSVMAYRDGVDLRLRLRDRRRITEPRIEAAHELLLAITQLARSRGVTVHVHVRGEEDAP